MYINLALAIVEQANKDYQKALYTHRTTASAQRKKHARAVIAECENFFTSDWCLSLTSIDGASIIARAKEVVK